METGDWPKPGVDLIVHHTNSVDPRKLEAFARLGVKLIPIEPWGTGNAVYCNKLRQLETPEVLGADIAIFLDTDVVVARPFAELFSSSKIRGKIVDHPNPPEEVWSDILSETIFADRDIFQGTPSMRPETRTPTTNFNGGVYFLPQAALATIKALWPKWSNFCLERGNRLGKFGKHADQMGFALAMLESGFEFEPLSIGENFPLHFDVEAYKHVDPCDLTIIHYHWNVDNHGLPKPVGVEWIDEQVQAVAKRIGARRKEAFDNKIFWDYRYHAFPELGPGVG